LPCLLKDDIYIDIMSPYIYRPVKAPLLTQDINYILTTKNIPFRDDGTTDKMVCSEPITREVGIKRNFVVIFTESNSFTRSRSRKCFRRECAATVFIASI
jgi:hypothetical protein